MKDSFATDSGADDGGRVIRAFGQEAHVLVSSRQTNDAFCVLRIFASPANVTPPHLHRATDETFLIESGEVEIDGTSAWSPVTCTDCSEEWRDVFFLAAIDVIDENGRYSDTIMPAPAETEESGKLDPATPFPT